MKPHVCPMCGGWTTTAATDRLARVTCPACKGTGIVWEPSEGPRLLWPESEAEKERRRLAAKEAKESPITKEGRDRLERGGGPALAAPDLCMCPKCGTQHIDPFVPNRTSREMTPAEREHRRIMGTE